MIRLINGLLNASIWFKFVLCMLTKKLHIYYIGYACWHDYDPNSFILNSNLQKKRVGFVSCWQMILNFIIPA